MLVFDSPTREVCTISRGRTATPLQALVLLNDVQFVEPARALAASAASDASSPQEKIANAFLRLTGRPPDSTEINLLTDVYNEQLGFFKDKADESASKFTKLGETATPSKLVPAELAALTVTCQTILNLDVTVYER
jgi:hypothetical protein